MAAKFDKELALQLCNLEVPNRIRFSPDGKRIVFSTSLIWSQRAGKNNVSTIWLASTDEPGSARKLTSGSFNDRNPTWLPDGSGIVFVSDRSKPGDSSALWLMRLDGGDPTALTPADNTQGIEVFSISPDGKTIAYSSADETSDERKKQDEAGEPAPPDVWGEDIHYARLRVVDVESKETKLLVSTDRHITRMYWSPDGTHLTFRSVQNLEIEEPARTGVTISSVNVASGEVRELCVVMSDLQNLTWAPDGKIYFTCCSPMRMISGGMYLFSVDPSDSEPKPVKAAFGVENDIESLMVAGGKLVALYYSRLMSVISEVNGPIIATKDTKCEVWDVHFDAENGGKPILAASLSDINNPYEVIVIEEGKSEIKLSNHGKELQGKSFGSCTVLRSQSSDGKEELDALYLAPAGKVDADGKPKEPLPTFVMIHGGPMDRNCNSFDSSYIEWSPYLLSQGYGLLLPQYRGSTGRGEAFASYSATGVGDFDYSDVISITDNAIKSGFADSKNLIAGGWSQGGYLGYLCSVRNGLHGLGWQFNAIIAGAGISDWQAVTLESDCGDVFESELIGGRSPWQISKDDTSGRKGSAIYEIKHAVEESRRLGKMVIPPMLIVHGRNDARCPLPQAEGFRRALRFYGLPCEFVVYPGQGHIPTAQRYVLDTMERMGRWCHDYIGPGKKEK